MYKKLLAASVLGLVGVSGAQAQQTLPPQTGQILSAQTNWGTSTAFNDGVRPAITLPPLAPMIFDQFDPTQGGTGNFELLSVTINLTGSFTGNMSFSNQAPPGGTETTITQADLEVRMLVDIFSDYDGIFANNNLIELSGFAFDDNFDSDLVMSDSWKDLPPTGGLPLVLQPGESAFQDGFEGSWAKTLTYPSGTLTPGGLSPFIGAGTFNIGCLSASRDITEASGGSSQRGHEAFAQCGAEVVYNFREEIPVPAPLALLALGLTMLGVSTSRRRAASQA